MNGNYTVSLIRLARKYTSHSGLSLSYVGRLCANHGAFFSRLEDGHDITSRRAGRTVQWFSDHWPANLEWPAEIERPEPAPDSPAVRAARDALSAAAADPINAVRAARKRYHALIDAGDLDGAERAELDMMRAATILGPDARIASPAALCEALNAQRYTYDDVVRRYARGGPARREPRPGTITARMVIALRASGDRRFAPMPLERAS